jgi:hypothetical protein
MCPAVIILLLLGTQKMGVFPWLELKVIALAPKVPPKHRLDLCTGEVVIIE